MSENADELLRQARLAIKNSYSPYSHFAVGAAIRAQDGTIFTGANVENSSYSMTICAERVAAFKAVVAGHRSFTDLAIASSSGAPTSPCGACRQVLIEFSPNLAIRVEGDERVFRLIDLLPEAFTEKPGTNTRYSSVCILCCLLFTPLLDLEPDSYGINLR